MRATLAKQRGEGRRSRRARRWHRRIAIGGKCPECGSVCHEGSERRRFDVHIFAVVRITVPNVRADDYEGAIDNAVTRADLERRCRQPRDTDQYADEVSHYVVDVCGDRFTAKLATFLTARIGASSPPAGIPACITPPSIKVNGAASPRRPGELVGRKKEQRNV